MKIQDLRNRKAQMTLQERHAWLEFIANWYYGTYMRSRGSIMLNKWKKFRQLYPTGYENSRGEILYRMITIPRSKEKQKTLDIKPSPYPVSSWSTSRSGIDMVYEVAKEFTPAEKLASTSRVAIRVEIPGNLILATPSSIMRAFLELSDGYLEKYPQQEQSKMINGERHIRYVNHPDYPGGNSNFDIEEVGYFRAVLQEIGSYQGQREVVVHTPSRVRAEIIQIYRSGKN